MSTTQENTSSLQDFNFDEPAEFFGIKDESEETKMKNLVKQVKNDNPDNQGGEGKPKPTKKDDEEEEEEEVEPEFSFTNPEDENDVVEVKDTKKKEGEDDENEDGKEDNNTGKDKDKAKEQTDDEFYRSLALQMKEKGMLSAEVKEDEELTEEGFVQLQEQEITSRVNESFEEFFESLDQDAIDFIKFKRNGGRTSDFITSVQSDFDFDTFDAEKPEDVNQVIDIYLTTVEKLEGEDLKERKKYLKETGKETVFAEKWNSSLKQSSDKRKADLVKAQADLKKQKEADNKAYEDAVIEQLNKTSEVGSLTIDEKEAKELAKYMFNPTVKVGKNRFVPELQVELTKALQGKTEEDRKNLIAIAKVFRDKFQIATKPAKKIKTEVTKEIRKTLRSAAESGVATKTGGANSAKSVADFF